MKLDPFFQQVAEALSGCQFVEQELKLYISQALELVRRQVEGKLPFKMCGPDYAESSLEKLIDIFRKLSDAPQLVEDLKKFKAKRNFLSHKAITHCLDPDGEVDLVVWEEYKPQLREIVQEAQRLKIAIWNETTKFAGDMWLDEMMRDAKEPPSSL